MKKIIRRTAIVLLLLLAGLYATVEMLQRKKFEAPYPPITSSRDSTVIANGKKLVFGAAHCAGCHGSVATNKPAGENEEISLSGGRAFDLPIGIIYAPNITPHATGIASKSDEAIARALRYGVSTGGKALFDFMPFHNTSDEDLAAIISYLRSCPAVDNEVPDNKTNLLGKLVKAFILKPVGPNGKPPTNVVKDTGIAYGAYLATSVANCRGCHTNRDLMTGAFTGEDFAGGLKMESVTAAGKFSLTTPNLTTDASGRITGWSQEQFITRFRKGRTIKESHMPWESFSHMSDDELKSVYKFLQTVKPVHNKTMAGLVKEK